MRQDREYRFADAWIGAFLGAFVGGVIAVVGLFSGFDDVSLLPLLFLVGTFMGLGAVACGSLAYFGGKRFTDRIEAGIRAAWEFWWRDRDNHF